MLIYLINDTYLIKIEGFDGSSITDMEFAEVSDPNTWYTFGSVALETPSAMDVNNGYGWATHKFVGFGESISGDNMIFFTEAFGPGGAGIGDSTDFHGLRLPSDWSYLIVDTGLVTATFQANLLTFGLAHNYILDANSTDMVNAVNGSDTGVVYQSELGRNYAYFDASSSYVDLGHTSNMGLGTSNFTISAWVRCDDISATSAQIFGSIVTGASSPSKHGMHLLITQGQIRYVGGVGGVSEDFYYTLPAGFEGVWKHVAITRNGTQVKLYIDGSLVHAETFSAVHDMEATTGWHKYGLGAYNWQGTWYDNYVGGIDNVMIYDRLLGDAEVAELHTSTTVTVPASVTVDQDPSSVSVGDVMTATVDLQGGTLGYFAWEQYDAVNDSWTVVAGGSNSVVDMTVSESMSEATMKISMEVDSQWYFSADMSMPVLQTLVGYWSFDNGDATADVGPDGTATGASFGTQDGRTVVQYDGSGDYVTIPYSADQQPQAAITVATWLKFDSAGNWYDFPVYQPGTGGNQYSYSIWRFRDDGSNAGIYGKLAWRVMTANGNVDAMTSFIPNTGQWYHVVGTYDGSEMKLYIDGSLETTVSQTGNIPHYANQPLYLGRQAGYPESGTTISGKINGSQDDVRIYSKALDLGEVQQLHDSTLPPATPIMVNGTFPLYATESDANGHAGGDGSSHSHVFDGVTYHMPNGLEMGVTQFHGTFGQTAQYSLDADVSTSIGSNDGSSSSASFVTDSARPCVSFDGEDDYLQIPNPAELSGDTWTISQWVKTSATSGRQDFFSKWYQSNGNYATIAMGIDGGVLKAYYRGNNKNSIGIMTGPSIANGEWHHIVYVKDSSEVRIYVDGSEVDQAAFSGTIPSTADVVLGAWDGSILGYAKDHYFEGFMDDVRFYDRAMTTDEVAYWHTETTVENIGIMSRYTFDDGDVVDSVGSADGTASSVTFETLLSRTAATFGGSGGIDIPHTADQGFGGTATTVSAWFKTTQTDQGYAVLKGYGGGNNEMWLIAINEDGGPANKAMFYWRNRAQNVIKLHSTSDINDGAWHHIVTVRDGGNLSLYVDGALEAFSTGATGTFDPTQAMRLGKWDHDSHSAGTFYVGSMDDVIIYNEALNASAVADLYANTTVVHTPSNDVALSVFTADAWGDTWNGNVLSILDANGAVVATSNGPASGVKAPAGLTESASVPNNADYTWTLGGGSYMNEVQFSITHPDGTVLVNVTNGQTTSAGSFTVGTPVVEPTIDATVDSFVSDEITLSVSMNPYGESVAAGWSYRLDDGYVVGQPHGGTVVAMGQTAAISVTPGETTIYVASIDSNANVLAVNSVTQNTVVVSIAINKSDSYGDGWNGAAFTMTDSNGAVVVNETLTSGGKPGPVTVNVQLAAGTYDYALSAGSYPGEVFMTVVNTDSSETLIDIPVGGAPASGQVIISPAQASVTLSATSGFEAIYVSATPNQQALDDGATQWALLGSDTFGDVGTTIDPAIPLSDLANMAYIYTSTEDALTGYAAIVDSSGLILAKSSVSGQAMINQLSVGQEMVLMAVLAPMFLDGNNSLAGVGTIPSTLSDGNNLDPSWQFGPFYLGDLQVSSYGTITTDFGSDYDTGSGLLIPADFNDGMGGTGSAELVGKMVKDLIRKLDLHQLDGDLAPYGAIFQSVLAGSDKDATKLIDPEQSSLMMKQPGGGYVESSQYKMCHEVGELGIGEGIRNMTIPDQLLLLDNRDSDYDDAVDPSAIKGVLAPADSVISGQASVSSGEVTMSASVGEFAQAQGAVGWVYLLDQSVGDVGQTTSETVISLGSDAVFTPSPAGYTAYVAAVDASGVIMATDSFVFDTTPMRLVKWKWYTTDWSGLNGGRMTLTDSLGADTMSPVVGYDTNGAWHEGDIFELREDVYSWEVNEHSIRASDQGHLKLVEVDSQGAEIREIIYVWALQTRMHKDGTSWPNQEFSGQFALPEDTVDPVLTLLGDASMTVYTGGQFVDPGYSVSDNLDPAPVVTVSGHESIAVSEAWIASTPQDGAPVINGDLLTFDNPNWFDHTVHKSTNIPSSEEAWEVVVEFDNYSAYNNHSYNALDLRLFNTSGVGYLNVYLGNAGGLGAHAGYKDGDNMQQQAFSPIGLISSGALKIARENGNFKFYYSLDKVSFTLIQQFPVTTADVLGNVFGTDDLQISLRAKDAAVDVTDFSRTDMPYGAQQGNYTITYSASDFSGNVHALQRTVSVVPETYEWHHGNQLTDIVKYLHGYDADGERSHMYLKDDDGLTVLYFTPDLETFASFTSYDVDQHFIEGAPVCAAYGPAGKVLLGTSTGCVYLIQVGTLSVPQSFTKVHDNGGMRINQVHFGATSNAWLIEYNEEVHTMPAEGGILTMRMSIPAGSFVLDFAQADDATSIIIRKADYSFATYIAMPGWATIHDESAMRAIFSSLGVTNVDYDYALDRWTAADDDYNVIATDQIIDWLLS